MASLQELANGVERLLLRHQELQRTSALLQEHLGAVTQERDSLRSRLNAARQRIDVLLERLPQDPPARAAEAMATPAWPAPRPSAADEGAEAGATPRDAASSQAVR